MLLLIDNYDSFTYNICHYFEILGQTVLTRKNDALSLEEIERLQPDYIVLSPGPNTPSESGICMELIGAFHTHIPMLGICLGHQCLGQYFGMTLSNANKIVHGKATELQHNNLGIFKDLPPTFQVGRYHSLCLSATHIPAFIQATAWSQGILMGIQHRQLPLFGIQFHPESILSEHGLALLENFIYAGHKRTARNAHCGEASHR